MVDSSRRDSLSEELFSAVNRIREEAEHKLELERGEAKSEKEIAANLKAEAYLELNPALSR